MEIFVASMSSVVRSGLERGRWWKEVATLVGIDIEFGVWWKFFVLRVIVLVSFDPLYLAMTSQFFVEIADE
jgi:hypothetical protein